MTLATLEGGNGSLSMPEIVNGSTVWVGLLLLLPALLSGSLGGELHRHTKLCGAAEC